MEKIRKEEKPDFGSNIFFGKLGTEITELKTQDEILALENQVTEKMSSIAQDAMKVLQEERLPPLPANYQLYFERLLEKEEDGLKEKVQDALDLQSIAEDRAMSFEKNVKEGFRSVKEVLELIAMLYKNLQLIQAITGKYAREFENINNKVTLMNMVSLFLKDLGKVGVITSTQLAQIKDIYQKAAKAIADINQSTIYDSRFGVYNKRYFMSLIEKENKILRQFNHSSSLLVIALSKKLQPFLEDKSISIVLFKNVAKLLLKNSRRSDMIGYLGEGVFGIGLKYSDINSAVRATEKFIVAIKTTNIFLGNNDIVLEVSAGLAKIYPKRSVDDSLSAAISALQMALSRQKDFEIFPQDKD